MDEKNNNAIYSPIRQFKGFIAIERGLSENTSNAYLGDLEDFAEYLCESGFTQYSDIEREDIEDYLYYNTRFERASRSRYGFGSLFRGEDGKVYIKLNLQIRFLK